MAINFFWARRSGRALFGRAFLGPPSRSRRRRPSLAAAGVSALRVTVPRAGKRTPCARPSLRASAVATNSRYFAPCLPLRLLRLPPLSFGRPQKNRRMQSGRPQSVGASSGDDPGRHRAPRNASPAAPPIMRDSTAAPLAQGFPPAFALALRGAAVLASGGGVSAGSPPVLYCQIIFRE